MDDYSTAVLIGYLRSFEVTATLRNGLPVLRTQQHTSCCEHEVTFFAFNGQDYSAIASCSQRYDTDETPVPFCDDRKNNTP